MFLNVVFDLPLEGTFTYRVDGSRSVAPGLRVEVLLRGRKKIGCVVEVRETLPVEAEGYTITSILRVIDKEPIFTKVQVELSQWIAQTYLCSPGEALFAMLPRGRRHPPYSDETPTYSRGRRPELILSREQQEAAEGILASDSREIYLHGVTGSGKTEVFLTVIERVVESGSGCIYLVPEISLTNQLVQQVMERFGGGVAILHSRLTHSKRLAEWMRILKGDVRLVLGARSGVFAPVKKLGLIVIDEEHEGSYKSDSTPRYHARQVAMRRSRMERAKVVMGSATPSLEAYHLFKSSRLERYQLSTRLSGGSMPRVKVVDLGGEEGCLSVELVESLKRVIRDGRQAILFLNRRGFSTFFNCRSCRHELKCTNCSVGLTYHKSRQRLICHYCGFSQPPVEYCPSCGSLDVGYAGFGIEAVEEEVGGLFPNEKITRIDTDSIASRESLDEKLTAFRREESSILLGTQMIAKGFNFPGVRLVGIVLADSGFNLPDFRATERSFAVIHQVAGRAGRYTNDGEVIIQTYRRDHPSVVAVQTGGVENFYQQEIESRREMGFPPFCRIIRVTVRGSEQNSVASRIGQLSRSLRKVADGSFDIMGPAECPLSRVSGKYRHHLLIRTNALARTRTLLRGVLARDRGPRGEYIEVDVDPVNLL